MFSDLDFDNPFFFQYIAHRERVKLIIYDTAYHHIGKS